jgi:hypothetical protein
MASPIPKPRSLCLCDCGERVRDRHSAKFASLKCQQDYQYRQFVKAWLAGEISGGGGTWETPSKYVRRYILERDGYKCVVCGWGQKNPHTDTWPLVLDHIDGNASRTVEPNLRTLCPNCDSLTSTYRGANRGNGRLSRRRLYHKATAEMRQ